MVGENDSEEMQRPSSLAVRRCGKVTKSRDEIRILVGFRTRREIRQVLAFRHETCATRSRKSISLQHTTLLSAAPLSWLPRSPLAPVCGVRCHIAPRSGFPAQPPRNRGHKKGASGNPL